MKTARCNRCEAPIIWARWESKNKWVSVDPETCRSDDRTTENDFGHTSPVFETWHRFHRCAEKNTQPNHSEQVAAAYAALHLMESAPPEVVRAAYRALAAMHHPDKGGDTRIMQNLNLAFELAMAVRS